MHTAMQRVEDKRNMDGDDRTIGYQIAREGSYDESTKVLYVTGAIADLKLQ